MKFTSGIRPYSQAERDRDHEAKREVRAVEANRQNVLVSGQDYHNRPGTRAERRRWQRIIGETED